MECAFRALYDRDPDGLWAAPGRVNVIGEHTDYNDGFVLPAALERGVVVALARRRDTVLRMASRQRRGVVESDVERLAPGAVHGWAGYVAGVVWALRDAGHGLSGYDLLCDGDLPPGAGLSSSAAMECAVALAVAESEGIDMDRPRLALLAQQAENAFVGVPCGIMDQLASLLCRADHALLVDTRSLEHEPVPLSLAAAGLRLLVVDTRASRRLVDSEYAARRRDCQQAAGQLGVPALRDVRPDLLDDALAVLSSERLRRRVRHVVTENARVLDVAALLRAGRIDRVGPLLSASHASLRDDYEVSCPRLDVAVDAAAGAGALGARMTGAGFGGCILALVDEPDADDVAAAVGTAFRRHGFVQPRHFAATGGPGARRLR